MGASRGYLRGLLQAEVVVWNPDKCVPCGGERVYRCCMCPLLSTRTALTSYPRRLQSQRDRSCGFLRMQCKVQPSACLITRLRSLYPVCYRYQ